VRGKRDRSVCGGEYATFGITKGEGERLIELKVMRSMRCIHLYPRYDGKVPQTHKPPECFMSGNNQFWVILENGRWMAWRQPHWDELFVDSAPTLDELLEKLAVKHGRICILHYPGS
jgi:hypothetical protein